MQEMSKWWGKCIPRPWFQSRAFPCGRGRRVYFGVTERAFDLASATTWAWSFFCTLYSRSEPRSAGLPQIERRGVSAVLWSFAFDIEYWGTED